ALLTRHSSSVYVLPAPQHLEEAEGVTGSHVDRVLRWLRARFRYVVVDTPRTLTEATLVAAEQSEQILLLADLTVPSVRAARRTVELFSRLQIPADRVALVMTEAVRGPVRLDDATRAIGKSPYFTIPNDPTGAGNAMNAGAPLNGKPDSTL